VPLVNSSSQSNLMNKQLFFPSKAAAVKPHKRRKSLEQKTQGKNPGSPADAQVQRGSGLSPNANQGSAHLRLSK